MISNAMPMHSKQEKHHVWVQTARLYLHLICIISNKYQNSGIFSKKKRLQSIPKHISKMSYPAYKLTQTLR